MFIRFIFLFYLIKNSYSYLNDSTCSLGIRDGAACCNGNCTSCGGIGCSLTTLGASNCCSNTILKSNKYCNETTAPCIIVSSNPVAIPDPTCSLGLQNKNICCNINCTSCGGSSCSKDPMGGYNCCTSNILNSNYSCSDYSAPCVINLTSSISTPAPSVVIQPPTILTPAPTIIIIPTQSPSLSTESPLTPTLGPSLLTESPTLGPILSQSPTQSPTQSSTQLSTHSPTQSSTQLSTHSPTQSSTQLSSHSPTPSPITITITTTLSPSLSTQTPSPITSTLSPSLSTQTQSPITTPTLSPSLSTQTQSPITTPTLSPSLSPSPDVSSGSKINIQNSIFSLVISLFIIFFTLINI
jgi:hypothetical protein